MGLFSKKVSCIGLDIGEHTIKIMEVRPTGSGYEVINFGIALTPTEGSAAENEQNIVSTLQKLMEKLAGNSTGVAMAVSGENIIVRDLTVPPMPDNELTEAVRYEAEALLPIPGKDVTIDFVKSDIILDGDIKKQEILIVAVRNETIDRLTRFAESVGLHPRVIDIEPLTLFRAMKKLNPGMLPSDGSYAVINIGSASTNISVFKGSRLLFTRTAGIGGQKLSEILTPMIGELVTEVRRSLEYYLAQYREQKISHIFMTGGGTQQEGLTSYINSELGIPVVVFNPAQYLQVSRKIQHLEKAIIDAGAALTQVAGLALSEVD
ncbi:MAG: type IV pilus biogenesis protein PilM [Eubacteriales bacterium]